MTTAIDRPVRSGLATETDQVSPAEAVTSGTAEPSAAADGPTAALPTLTPDMALQLAEMLAPHLLAMRAVTAGTRYEFLAEGKLGADGEPGANEPPDLAGGQPDVPHVSPATKIFIAGVLERLSA